MVKNQVQLITYPDSLGGSLAALNSLLVRYFVDIFPGGVHILPPFPSSSDRGFAPRTYFEIEPQFGSWQDVRRIAARFDVLLDLMVNHISRQSPFFQDFARHGRASEWADLFLTLDKIWPGGSPPPADVAQIFLRRPEHPFADIPIAESDAVERVWATFGTRDWSEQIDLDVHSPVTRRLFGEILTHFSQQGVRILRLDAIAFVIKKPGTNCFFVKPEIYEFMDWIREAAARAGIELLPEVHARYEVQANLAAHGYWVYNFALPLLILHALGSGSGRELRDHLRVCPRRQFTMLDCHDGIPVQPDLDGILDPDAAQAVVQRCLEQGGNVSRIYSVHHRLRPDFDAHQINCTYFSALGGDEDAYLASRAIQFFAPGVPQVYYVGLLAGENEPGEVERTGEKRAINRRNYSVAEVEQALQRPVVQRLLGLVRFRNEYPAFNGDFSLPACDDHRLLLRWQKGPTWCQLEVDLLEKRAEITYAGPQGEERLLARDTGRAT